MGSAYERVAPGTRLLQSLPLVDTTTLKITPAARIDFAAGTDDRVTLRSATHLRHETRNITVTGAGLSLPPAAASFRRHREVEAIGTGSAKVDCVEEAPLSSCKRPSFAGQHALPSHGHHAGPLDARKAALHPRSSRRRPAETNEEEQPSVHTCTTAIPSSPHPPWVGEHVRLNCKRTHLVLRWARPLSQTGAIRSDELEYSQYFASPIDSSVCCSAFLSGKAVLPECCSL
ncbi:hypothetical protein MTO96_012683 [Rhipicephalus appendiculatus]